MIRIHVFILAMGISGCALTPPPPPPYSGDIRPINPDKLSTVELSKGKALADKLGDDKNVTHTHINKGRR